MPRGRPRKKLDVDKLEKLAGIGCTMKEIASVMDVSVDTLERNYADLIKKGREGFHMSLRRLQYKSALAGNVTMLIWLGKQNLGQSDKAHLTHSGDGDHAGVILMAPPLSRADWLKMFGQSVPETK